MNVTTITMDPKLAREKLKAYRAAKHRDAETEYSQAAQAYEALAQGTPLLRLSQAIEQGGFYADNRPRLAIARADRREAKVSTNWGRPFLLFQAGPFDRGGNPSSAARRSATLNITVNQTSGRDVKPGYAIVPMVPPDVRPKTGQLKDWFVLWEVEHWADRPHFATASPDPLLLSHVAGDLYAILASWDLTPIEQAILEGAMRS